ncbi:hypothetical protein [Algoriphagus jejuensis]
MIKSLIFLFLAVFLVTSCKEDEAPQDYLEGTYENAGFNSDSGVSYVSQYTFQADGTYERISLLRKDGQLLGYNFYSNGTYTLRGEEFTLWDREMAGVNHDVHPDGYVESLELLEEYDIEPHQSNGVLRQLHGRDRIGIQMECSDLLLAMCIGEQIFDRVD